MRVILVTFLLLGVAWATLTCECGMRNGGRIVGGNIAKKNEFPWMVGLHRHFDNQTYCGGSILTPWHVLTAGHCVFGFTLGGLTLYIGAHDVNDASDVTRQDLNLSQIILHPQYRFPATNDIAILVTSTEITFNQFVGPICMPNGLSDAQLIGLTVKAMGWGRYNYTQPNLDKIKKLREVDLRIVSSKPCRISNGTRICTFVPGKDTCHGDSGGPLAWLDPDTNRFTVVGIVSYGPEKCGNVTYPGINTNVLHYQDWIKDTVGSTGADNTKPCYKV